MFNKVILLATVAAISCSNYNVSYAATGASQLHPGTQTADQKWKSISDLMSLIGRKIEKKPTRETLILELERRITRSTTARTNSQQRIRMIANLETIDNPTEDEAAYALYLALENDILTNGALIAADQERVNKVVRFLSTMPMHDEALNQFLEPRPGHAFMAEPGYIRYCINDIGHTGNFSRMRPLVNYLANQHARILHIHDQYGSTYDGRPSSLFEILVCEISKRYDFLETRYTAQNKEERRIIEEELARMCDPAYIALFLAYDCSNSAPDRDDKIFAVLERYRPQFTNSQDGINLAFHVLCKYPDRFQELRTLLEGTATRFKPDQTTVNRAYEGATAGYDANPRIAAYLKTRPGGMPAPNMAPPIEQIIIANNLATIREFLPPLNAAGQIDTTQVGNYWTQHDIIIVYRDLRAGPSEYAEQNQIGNMPLSTMRNLADLLEPYVPVAERQPQQTAVALTNQPHHTDIPAMEIHNYMNVAVDVPAASATSADVCPSTQMTLNDAVFDGIHQRMVRGTQLTREQLLVRLNSWIDSHHTDPADRARAKAAVDKGWNRQTENRLSDVIAFLEQHHPGSIGVWIRGFATESITAYQNSSNGTSCAKGIDERIVTGLRGIDSSIDQLFKTPEMREMVKRFFASLRIDDPTNAKFVAKGLFKNGVRSNSPSDKIIQSAHAFIDEHILSHGATSADYADQKRTAVELITDYFDAYIRLQIERIEQGELTPSSQESASRSPSPNRRDRSPSPMNIRSEEPRDRSPSPMDIRGEEAPARQAPEIAPVGRVETQREMTRRLAAAAAEARLAGARLS